MVGLRTRVSVYEEAIVPGLNCREGKPVKGGQSPDAEPPEVPVVDPCPWCTLHAPSARGNVELALRPVKL